MEEGRTILDAKIRKVAGRLEKNKEKSEEKTFWRDLAS